MKILSLPLFGCALLSSTIAAQTMVSYSPSWALNQTNSNNIYPYSTSPQRYMQIHDWDTFSRQGVLLIRGVRYRASLQFNYTNRTGRTVEIEMRMGLAPAGVNAVKRSTTFAKNWDAKTIKVVIKKKKVTFPTSGPTHEALKEFTVKFPFDSNASFLYITSQKRSLVIETKQYATGGGGYAFDFWSSTATMKGGYSHRNGSYLGCLSKSKVLVTHAIDGANLYVGSPAWTLSGEGNGATIPGVVTLGAKSMSATIPGTTCQLKNDFLVLVPFVTGAAPKGSFSLKASVPNNNNLARASFLTQAIYLEAGANTVGLTTSRGLVNGIGTGSATGGRIARVYYRGNPDSSAAATASSNFTNGLVTMFHN